MIEKKTVVDQIEVTRHGPVGIRIAILLIEDGEEIDCKWHRTIIEPGGDVETQTELVSQHLISMGKLPLSADDVARIASIVAVAHGPEVVRAYAERRAAASPSNVVA